LRIYQMIFLKLNRSSANHKSSIQKQNYAVQTAFHYHLFGQRKVAMLEKKLLIWKDACMFPNTTVNRDNMRKETRQNVQPQIYQQITLFIQQSIYMTLCFGSFTKYLVNMIHKKCVQYFYITITTNYL